MPIKTVTRCVPQPTAKMSVSEGVSQMWVFYDSGTPIRLFHFSEKKSRQIDDFRFRKFRRI